MLPNWQNRTMWTGDNLDTMRRHELRFWVVAQFQIPPRSSPLSLAPPPRWGGTPELGTPLSPGGRGLG